MKIYLDMFFLINAAMNYVVLSAVSVFRKRKIHPLRMLLGASLGAGLAVLILVCGIHTNKIIFIPVYALGISLPVYFVFGKTTFPYFAGNVAAFFVLSGILAAVMFQWQRVFRTESGCLLLLAGCAVFIGGIRKCIHAFFRAGKRQSDLYRVRLFFRGKELEGMGLLDTGNGLYEPFFHEPAALAQEAFLAPVLCEKELVFCYIPFHSVGNGSDFLPAFRAEKMEMEQPGCHVITVKDPWIAVVREGISINGEYQVILHPDMMGDGGEKNDDQTIRMEE